MAFTFLLALPSWCAMHMLFHVQCTNSISMYMYKYMQNVAHVERQTCTRACVRACRSADILNCTPFLVF